ncbi:MAG: heme exporter protein CcmB [Firmicutes bacterium]|nr:heme exporter protein CcmB [Bacillota bacterium]
MAGGYGRALLAVFRKELITEARSGETLGTSALFAFLLLTLLSLAGGGAPGWQGERLAAALWLVLLFAGALLLQRSFAQEMEEDAFLQLLLWPVDRSALYFGKALAAWLYLLLLGALLWLAAFALLGATARGPLWALALALVLGTGGLAGAGSFLAAVTARLRAAPILLPVLLFPLLVPLLLAAVRLSGWTLAGGAAAEPLWWQLMAGYDLLLSVVPALLFELIWEG